MLVIITNMSKKIIVRVCDSCKKEFREKENARILNDCGEGDNSPGDTKPYIELLKIKRTIPCGSNQVGQTERIKFRLCGKCALKAYAVLEEAFPKLKDESLREFTGYQ
jgi:hypothetical protein